MSQQQYQQQGDEEEWHAEFETKYPSVLSWPGKPRRKIVSVYKAINAVQAALAKTGIAKDRTNTQGSGYKFRGIDDVYNAISPLLAEYGLCILPRMISRQCDEKMSQAGKPLFYVTVEAEFDVVAASDGSKHTIRTFGEAMDSGDKATNKAMSAAYKYAAFQMFAIPTEGDNDADSHTHDLAARNDRRENWLADQYAAIDTASTAGELKQIVIDALATATRENDADAIDRINRRADAKRATAKPKTAGVPA